MNVKYRFIEKRDNPALAKLIRSTFIEFGAHTHEGTIFKDPTTDNLYDLFSISGAFCYVAEYGNEVVGCCGVFPTQNLPKHCAELVKFYVLQSCLTVID